MKILINYANKRFRKAQIFNTKTALEIGKVDCVLEYGPELIDKSFFEKNRKILEHQKGAGYWLWKPYIILDALKKFDQGDVIIYSDSASHFLTKVDYLTDLIEQSGQDIIPFELELLEKDWSKRDAFVIMGVEDLDFHLSRQRLGSPIIAKVSDFSINFFEKCLNFATDARVISDAPNTCGLDNYFGFQSNRHDQTIFSLLSKKYGLQAFRDPSQFGNPRMAEYPNSQYPQVMELTRQPSPKQARMFYKHRQFLKRLLRKLWI